MAAYSTGTARITAGMTKVYGNGTSWDVFLAAGDLFKIQGDNVFYEIGSVESASELTLTSRYVNANFQNAVATNVASVNTATKMYSGSLIRTPVILNSIRIVASTAEAFTDNGLGILAGNASPAGSGTIDYDSGAWAITFGTSLTATVNLAASFNQGTLNQGLSYQAVVDFTPFYSIPEMSTNDVNFAHIFTKAMRIVDKQISLASLHTTASVVTASHFHGTKSATMNNMSIINASITNASIQKLKVINASINNASINTLKVVNFVGSVVVLEGLAVLTNATINEASIYKLKNANASITQASINNLWVQKVRGVNASFVNASIQKLKTLNASITNASADKLSVRTTITVGKDKVRGGAVELYGDSDDIGGDFRMYPGAQEQANASYFRFMISSGNLRIGPDTDSDSLVMDASLNRWSFTGAGGVAITTGLTAANASFVEASIQTLKVITSLRATNASFVQASIQKLKALNASITNATVGVLTVETGELNVTQGIVRFGVNHSIQGALSLYGNDGALGGKMILWGGDTADTSIDRYIYAMVVNAASPSYSDLNIGPDTDADSLEYNGLLGRWDFTGAGGVKITAGITAANASFVEASIQTLKVLNPVTFFKATNASLTNASIQNLKVLNAVTVLKVVNASLTNASIQKLKVLSASINEASINTLKTQTFNPTTVSIVNASITNASIQKLKVLNASIANASINTLKTQTFNPTTLKVVNGSITNATIQHLTVHASRLNTDQTWDGYSLNATMAATVAFGEVLYTDSSFDYGLANCATSGTLPVSAMAVSAGAGKQKIILRGQICATVWNWSPGLIYCAATDGALTQLIAAGSGKIVQIMGHSISADTMFFNPNKGTVKIV